MCYTCLAQASPKSQMVVYLAIVNQHIPTTVGVHGLAACGGKLQNRKTRMDKYRDARSLVPNPRLIRSTMMYGGSHLPGHTCIIP